jgi:pimeloyl-ACP methyl ester carboxylesterase
MLNLLLTFFGVLLAVILLLVGGFLAYRYFAPRRTPGIKGEHAIAELFTLSINGVRQWLLIRGVDRRKPVLLFAHGGPGSAHIGILRNFQNELEKNFVVVQWDQRGAGLSGLESVPDETYTKEQFVADGLAVTQYLRERFKQDRIFLVGHSWGSGLGYILAVRHPEYYRAFAGLGQMARDGESLAYAETLKVAREANNPEAIQELELLGAPPYKNVPKIKGVLHQAEPGHEAFAGMMVRFKWSEALGGDAKYIKIANLVVKELLLSTEYSLTDAFAWLKNKAHSVNLTYEECNQNLDLYKEGTEFKIPVFFLLGKWDLLTVPMGAVALMEVITAPQKEIIWFDSGHEIHWERPKEYQEALIDRFVNLSLIDQA